MFRMMQQIRFCTSFDGVRVAYAISGEGPPLVMSASWLTHLEHQWRSLAWKPWLEYLSGRYTLIRYDSRGSGLSDRDVREVSFDIWIRDFEAVIDAAGFDRFFLLGTCQGGPLAIEYAARHPERVERLVLYASYARGLAKRNEAGQAEKAKVLLDMLGLGWGQDSHAFMQVWASLFQPGGTIEHLRSWSEQQRLSTSAETAAKMFRTTFSVDVQQSARRIKCPALVINPEREALVPLEEGRRLAGLIPDARFVTLDTNNHMLLPEEPAWHRLLTEMEAFLHEPAPQAKPRAPKERFAELTQREREVLDAIARGLDNAEIAASLHLSEKTVRNHITRVLDKIGVEHRYQAIVVARDAGLGGARSAPR